MPPTDPPPEITQRGFDSLGPDVRSAQVASARQVNYVDTGSLGGPTLLFLGGAGTTVRAFGLMEFARTLREQLCVRVVSVERNGLGQTPFDPASGPAEYAADVWSLLDLLGVEQVSVVAISGGGPYAAYVLSRRPARVRSVHLACALSDRVEELPSLSVEELAADPVTWWRFPDDSPVYRVPGFADSVVEEATRGMFARGRDTPPEGLEQALEIYRAGDFPDLSGVQAPGFFYWGSADPVVPTLHLRRWRQLLPGTATTRVYDDEGHDVQYRHWDQILADVAFLGERVVVCSEGRTLLVAPDGVAPLLERGGSLGLCAWSAPAGG